MDDKPAEAESKQVEQAADSLAAAASAVAASAVAANADTIAAGADLLHSLRAPSGPATLDGAWVADQASDPPAILHPVATKLASLPADDLPPGVAEAVQTVAAAARSQPAAKAVAKHLDKAGEKLSAFADKYGKYANTALEVGEKVRVVVSANARHIEAYASVVLLVFGSYFVLTIRTYEVMLRLGFVSTFSSVLSEARQALQDAAGASGLDKFKALHKRLTPLAGRVARTGFVSLACVCAYACVCARAHACVRAARVCMCACVRTGGGSRLVCFDCLCSLFVRLSPCFFGCRRASSLLATAGPTYVRCSSD